MLASVNVNAVQTFVKTGLVLNLPSLLLILHFSCSLQHCCLNAASYVFNPMSLHVCECDSAIAWHCRAQCCGITSEMS